ncbi:hypothetical protein HK097_005502, partial [Rhizophlyctis rosea]
MTTPWKSILQESLSASTSKTAKWPQLATVTPQNTPRVRTLAFRGFLSEQIPDADPETGSILIFTTDARSAKVTEIQGNNAGELC